MQYSQRYLWCRWMRPLAPMAEFLPFCASRVKKRVPWRLRAINADSLAPGPVGRLRPDTMRALEDLLKLVLDLP